VAIVNLLRLIHAAKITPFCLYGSENNLPAQTQLGYNLLTLPVLEIIIIIYHILLTGHTIIIKNTDFPLFELKMCKTILPNPRRVPDLAPIEKVWDILPILA
jgi:hypothetical protein